DYRSVLKVIVTSMADLGWIEPIEIPNNKNSTHRELWEFISANAKSSYIEFLKDAFYTSNFDKSLRPQTRQKVLKRLNTQKDIDLMIAMGTWAGQDMATSDHHTPTLVASTSDAIKSKIVKSAEDSGYDHIHAKVSPDRYKNHINLFHELVKFKRLGLVFEDSLEGRSFAAYDDVKEMSKKLGFEIVTCHAPFNNISPEEAEKAVTKCYEEIAPKIDAAYITVHRGVTLRNLPNILAPLNKHSVYTYSMLGSEEVRHGVLMSIALAGYKQAGMFYARTIAKIFNGAKPRSLTQKWVEPPRIDLNLKTARINGFDLEFDILSAADELYSDIAVEK
ncbi:ABC transporter substrate binding protein, partial [Desulfobacterales bacterium HSG17]|nr:ABC transporter substrate binding protein [Desulfobacterales bacterium HSG17]